jgi:hypothetical protein
MFPNTAACAIASGLALLSSGPGPHWHAAARALPNGITGYSGKQNQTCNQCHVGGTAPDVSFVGPDTLATNEVGTFQFVVTSQTPPVQDGAGFNVAAQAGTLAIIAGEGERRAGDGELTHTEPKENEAGVAMWSFTWKAPTQPGTYRLFGAGNSVNQNGQSSGDRARTTRFDVDVVAAPPSSTPTASRRRPPSATDHHSDGHVNASAEHRNSDRLFHADSGGERDRNVDLDADSDPQGTDGNRDGREHIDIDAAEQRDGNRNPQRDGNCVANRKRCTAQLHGNELAVELGRTLPGDCNTDGRVAINELVTGVGIALGTNPLGSCPRSTDDNGRVTIAELIAAVNTRSRPAPWDRGRLARTARKARRKISTSSRLEVTRRAARALRAGRPRSQR